MFSRQRTVVAAATTMTGLLLAMAPAIAHAAAPTATPAATAAPSARAYCGYYDGSATTKLGDTGHRVSEVQCIINYWAGGEVLDVDGTFGPRTESWVVHFQDLNGLQVDGIVGPETWAALRAV